MPEGHTLFRLAAELDAAFAGRVVRVGSPQGRFADSAALLDGHELVEADSWGKHLFIRFDIEQYVHVHLGLYGNFAVHPDVAEVPPPIGQVRMRLIAASGTPLAYADLRGATACELITPAGRQAILDRSGPDPLRATSDPEQAWRRIRAAKAPIGALLMDQAVLAGVGNVYRAEVLFRNRIDPHRPGHTLRRSQWEAIWADLVELMADGVRLGRIDTVRPEHTPEAMGREARKDDHGGEVYVYRRDGQECLVCSAKVRTEVMRGRNLFWCPRCQPRFRSRAVR